MGELEIPLKLPTLLTLSRLLLAPLFAIVYLYHDAFHLSLFSASIFLIVLMVFAETSDVLDGILARKWNQVTRLGKILDPISDSIVHLSALFAFTWGPVQLPVILVLLLFYRETLIGGLRTMCALNGVTLAARPTGKLKAIMQAVITFLILILLALYGKGLIFLSTLQQTSLVAVAFAAIYTWISALEYLWAYRSQLKHDFSN